MADPEVGYGGTVPNVPASSPIWVDPGDARSAPKRGGPTEVNVSGTVVAGVGLRVEAGVRIWGDPAQFYLTGGVVGGSAVAAGLSVGASAVSRDAEDANAVALRCYTSLLELDLTVTPDNHPISKGVSIGTGEGLGCSVDLETVRVSTPVIPSYVP